MELLRDVFGQLGIDKTLFLQFILVVAVYFLLSRIVFRKMLTLLLIRKHQITGMKNMAEMSLFDLDKLSKEYSERWQRYEEEVDRIKTEAQERSTRDATDLIRKTNKETDIFLKEKRSEILRQIIKIETELEPEVELMSQKLQNKLTKRDAVKRS